MRIGDLPSALPLQLDRVAVTLATLLISAMALTAPFYVGISGMRTTACTSSCDFELVSIGGAAVIYGLLATALTTFVGLLVLYQPDRYLWWLPCSALAAAIALVLIGNHLIALGVTARFAPETLDARRSPNSTAYISSAYG